jgi:ammonium transporter, Amt family
LSGRYRIYHLTAPRSFVAQVAHAFWSVNGFLSNTTASPLFDAGIIDLAGSGPVHMTGGVCALAAGIILGPRLGRFHDSDGNVLETPGEFPPHSVSLQFLGTFALWFGWYGFNPGSVLMISSTQLGNVAELVTVNTTLGACAGALSALFFSTWWDSYLTGVATYDAGYTMNGCLTGLVAITAGCATVEPWAAVVIGVVAGIVYLVGSKLLIHLRIDDAVDAIPVHLVGGAWGLISTGLFSNPDRMMDAFGIDKHVGWFYSFARGSGDFTLLGVQLIGVLFIFAWTFTIMGVFFLGLSYFGLLRIDPLEEEVGMDISRHKGSAYDMIVAHPDLVDKLNISRSGSKKGKVMGGIPTKEEEDVAATIEGPLEPAVEVTA